VQSRKQKKGKSSTKSKGKEPEPQRNLKSSHSDSDDAYDFVKPSIDYSQETPRRKRTASSSNPLVSIVNTTGICEMEILYCICSDAHPEHEQLFQAGLLPSTFEEPETAFTFSVLDDFLTDNLECKTTAQQYYSKLQSITNKMFPYRVPVCSIDGFMCSYAHWIPQNLYTHLLRASRQWRDLMNRMRSGISFQEVSQDGSMAIFCPACPQPGINLPNDWQLRYRNRE
jgi:hypothetical protein